MMDLKRALACATVAIVLPNTLGAGRAGAQTAPANKFTPGEIVTGSCWIDSLTGKRVDSYPPGWDPLSFDRNHSSIPAAPDGSRPARNFNKLPDGSWIDSLTGENIRTYPPGWDPLSLDPDRGHIPGALDGSRRAMNFVRVPCSPPATAKATPPPPTDAGPGRRAPAEGHFYLGGDVGLQLLTPISLDNAARQEVRTRYNPGVDVDFVVGYDFGNFRLEAEVGYREAAVESFNRLSIGSTEVSAIGRLTSTRIMTNVYYDLDHLFGLEGFGANIGGGVGVAATKVDLGERGAAAATFDNRNDVGLAWQLKAGLDKQLTDRLTLDLTYRYLSASSTAFATNGLRTDFEATGHGLTLGLRYAFGASPPPPPPPPEPNPNPTEPVM